jgi:hypothetical protein
MDEPAAPPGLVVVENINPRDPQLKRPGKVVSITVAAGCFLVGAGVVAAGILLADSEPNALVIGLVLYSVVAAPLFLAAALSSLRARFDSYAREVSFRDGSITLHTPHGTETHRVEDCCWFLGKAQDDVTMSYHLVRGRSVVLVFPSGKHVACGLTPENRREWKRLLERIGCRRVVRQEGWFGCVVCLFTLAGLGVGGLAGWRLPARRASRGMVRVCRLPFHTGRPRRRRSRGLARRNLPS